MSTEAQKKNHNRIRKLVNKQRKAQEAETSGSGSHHKISREVMSQVIADVWKKYPQDFSDPNYELNEATLDQINIEINQRLFELRKHPVER